MVTARTRLPAPPWSRSVMEWTLLGLVVAFLVWAFGHQVRTMHVQGERAVVQSMLGSLRTALVLSQVSTHVGQKPRSSKSLPTLPTVTRNPFLLLERMPANFAGEQSVAQADRMVPGTWVFDSECACIGYRLLYPEGLEVPPDAGAIWFRVEGLAGPLQIKALVPYVWSDQVVD